MSVAAPSRPPTADATDRARARETIWRLAALALAHPTPEFRDSLASGAFHDALGDAWGAVTGRPWPATGAPAPFGAFEAGYIAAFLHGPKGRPVASLLAGDHEALLAGLSRPVFMLNVSAFYRHFGLKAAEEDEGRADEPDHVSTMAEFMSVLCHLEARGLDQGGDPAPARRAQRDFLSRFLAPVLENVEAMLARRPVSDLDPTLRQLIAELASWSRQQIAELEARVGPYRDPDAPRASRPEAAPQNLWG